MAEKKKSEYHPRLIQLLQEIERLEKLVPKADLSISKDHSKFLTDQANANYLKNRRRLTTQIPLIRTSDTIKGRLEQLEKEATRVKQFLGTRYLNKASRNPLGTTWRFKPDAGSNKMVNPWYDKRFDTELIADKTTKLNNIKSGKNGDKEIPLEYNQQDTERALSINQPPVKPVVGFGEGQRRPKGVEPIYPDNKSILNSTEERKEKAPLSFEQQLAQNLQGVGQREFGKRDTATLEALKSSGYDTSGISRWDQSDFLRDLRIGHAFDTGKGTIMYKPNRGMMKVIRKKKEEA